MKPPSLPLNPSDHAWGQTLAAPQDQLWRPTMGSPLRAVRLIVPTGSGPG